MTSATRGCQAGAGAKGKIFVTDLDSLPGNIAVNKAELILSQNAPDTLYAAPLVLDLFRINDAGQAERMLEDELSPGFGGVRTTETVNGASVNRYHFNIKNYFQKLINGVYNNNGFYLQSYLPSTNAERVVLENSSTDQNYQIALYITYTKL